MCPNKICRWPKVERDHKYNRRENQTPEYFWSSEASHGTQKTEFSETKFKKSSLSRRGDLIW